jgi:polar amino acid transport system substrate-binding protein
MRILNSLQVVIFLLGLNLLSSGSTVSAATFEVGLYDYPPMMIEAERGGIYKDILDALAVELGDSFNVRWYPYPRINLMFNRGELNVVPGMYPGWVKDEAVVGVFSVPFARVVEVLVFAPGKYFKYKSPVDLIGKSVGLVRGYYYPELKPLIDSGQIDRRNGLNELQILAMLEAMRFDQVIVDKAVAQYAIVRTPSYKYLEIGDVVSSYDISMRVSPELQLWLPKLDAAILKLKKNGVIDKIYAKYGVHL